jgi:hypothetical protein
LDIQDSQPIETPIYTDSNGDAWWLAGYRAYIHS